MNEHQLHRFIDWLDARGAANGRTFAVHQADPSDPASRELVTLEVQPAAPPRPAKVIHLEGATAQRPSESAEASTIAPRFPRLKSAVLGEQKHPKPGRKAVSGRRPKRRRRARTARARRTSLAIWLAGLVSLAVAAGF